MIDFAAYPLPAILLASVAALLTAAEVGHQLGARAEAEANVTTLEAAILGLMALMLGFTFSMALARFDERRDALLAEANSIGTAALRARLLPAPHDLESLKLFKDYVQIRLDFSATMPSSAEAGAFIAHSDEIQEALWKRARLVAAKDNAMVPVGVYIQSLNEMFDNQQKRLTAFRNRVPNIVFFALYAIAFIAVGFSGFSSGLERRQWRAPVYVICLLSAGVILLIQDIDRPGAGYINVDQEPMIETAGGIAKYLSELQGAAAHPVQGVR